MSVTIAKPKKLRGIYLRGHTYWLAHQHRGRRLFTSLRTSDYAEAVRAAYQLLGTPTLNTTEGLLGDIHAFLEHQRDRRLYTTASIYTRRSNLFAFAKAVRHTPTQSVSFEQVRDWHAELKQTLCVATANTYLSNIQAFFRWAAATGRAPANPCTAVLRHRTHSRTIRFCTPAERDRIIATAPDDDLRYVYFCGFHAGLRKLEIIESRPEWFNLTVGTVSVQSSATFTPKNRRDRTIPLTAAFKAFLATYGLRQPFMLYPERQRYNELYRCNYTLRTVAHLKSLDLGWVTSHTMRHTFASILASRGCSIYKIARWLGDTIMVTQDHYAKLLPTDSDIDLLG